MKTGVEILCMQIAEHAVFRWFAVGLDGDSGFPTSFQSEPSSVEPVEHKRGVKPLVLVNNNLAEG